MALVYGNKKWAPTHNATFRITQITISLVANSSKNTNIMNGKIPLQILLKVPILTYLDSPPYAHVLNVSGVKFCFEKKSYIITVDTFAILFLCPWPQSIASQQMHTIVVSFLSSN